MIAPRKSDEAAAWRPAPLLPREAAQDLALVFVTAVLCFFACLSIIAALGADRAANGWSRQLQGSATVLVRPGPSETADLAVARAAETLAGTKGVREARALEKEKAYDLIRPWLGPAAQLDQLPVPRLVTVDLDPTRPATAQQLQGALASAGIDATVDDHSRWMLIVNKNLKESAFCRPKFRGTVKQVRYLSPVTGELKPFPAPWYALAPGQGVLLRLD